MPSDEPEEIVSARVLAVEGEEDRLFFDAFIKALGFPTVQVIAYNGKDKLRRFLRALVKMTTFDRVEHLGITRDADDSAVNATTSVRNAVSAADLPVPAQSCEPSAPKPRVSFIVVPPGANSGMLEDLCSASVADHPFSGSVAIFIESAGQAGAIPKNLAKARIQAFLAVQEDPGKRLGEAAQAGYFPFASAAFNDLRECLRRIFAETN